MNQDQGFFTIMRDISDKVDRLSKALINHWKDEKDRHWKRRWYWMRK